MLATTNSVENRISLELAADSPDGMNIHTIGDATAARTASMAFFEARRLAMEL